MQRILTINGGSSSIKFAVFEEVGPERVLEGAIERIGFPDASLWMKGQGSDVFRQIVVPDHGTAVAVLTDNIDCGALAAVGHRVVHGGQRYSKPHLITEKMIDDLQNLGPFDPEHMPEELMLIDAFHRKFPDQKQVACFDTAFHRDLPRVATLLPIPRRFDEKGIRRYGFHGLSYEFLMQELVRLGDTAATSGRVILAHLGNGASLSAVYRGKPLDTSMSFTPASGLMMSTRTGELDPGVAAYLMQSEKLTIEQFSHLVNHESGLLGVSGTSSDMRDLLMRETNDLRAFEAVELFCYQVKKYIGAYAAALGGLDVLVFSGGIGENSAVIRARICEGLAFLGIEIDEKCNAENEPVISGGRVVVRVVHTDEELMIAKSVFSMLESKIDRDNENDNT